MTAAPALAARVFRDADLQGGRFERGELVRVGGRVVRFRDQTQIELERIERVSEADAALDRAAFLPVAYRDLDELDGFLEHLAREVTHRGYARLLEGLLGDAGLRVELRTAACTQGGHHAYLGGLLEHTVAVATLAQELALGHPRLNSDLLICAAIVHDIGKTREFTYGATIERSSDGRLLGHLQIGLQDRPRARRRRRSTEPSLLALEHCVLSATTVRMPLQAGSLRERRGARALHRINALVAERQGRPRARALERPRRRAAARGTRRAQARSRLNSPRPTISREAADLLIPLDRVGEAFVGARVAAAGGRPISAPWRDLDLSRRRRSAHR